MTAKSNACMRVATWAERYWRSGVTAGVLLDDKKLREEGVRMAINAAGREREQAARIARDTEREAARFAGDPTCRDTWRQLKLLAAAFRAFADWCDDPVRSAFRGQSMRDERAKDAERKLNAQLHRNVCECGRTKRITERRCASCAQGGSPS